MPTQPGPLVLTLRPQMVGSEQLVRIGMMVDVVVGDPVFDSVFVVEGAPVDVMRHLLTPELRARLLAHPSCELTSTSDHLRLAEQGWIEEPTVAAELMQLALDLARRIPLALEAADEAVRLAGADTGGAGGPYRNEGTGLVLADEQRRQELARIDAVRWRRKQVKRAAVVGFLGLTLATILYSILNG